MLRNLIIKATHICNDFERRHYPILWLLSVLLPPTVLALLWSFHVYILTGFDCPWFFYRNNYLQFFLDYMCYLITPCFLTIIISEFLGLIMGTLFRGLYDLNNDEASLVCLATLSITLLLLFSSLWGTQFADFLMYVLHDAWFILLLMIILLLNIIAGDNVFIHGVFTKNNEQELFSFQYFAEYAKTCAASSRVYGR